VHLPANDAELAAYLDEANLPSLLPAIVQLSGDATLLERFRAPSPVLMGALQGDFSEEEEAELRAVAFEVLKAYRDGSGEARPLPERSQVHAMMNWCAGEELPDHYVDLATEEAALGERDPRRFVWKQEPSRSVLEQFRVVIIGAGFGGVCAAIRLEQAGIPYTILEKNDDIGGTWHENSYPDLRVDIPNHFYSYSFEHNPDWSDYFSRRDELKAYAGRCARKYGVDKQVRFNCEVLRAEWDEARSSWVLRVRNEEGKEEEVVGNALISAVGMLNRAQRPEIAGLDSFEGASFHSSQWRHDLDLKGKRIGVIGTGASAMQFVPPTAEQAGHLTVFQRAAHWASANAAYHAKVSEGFKWLLRHVPNYHSWYRFLVFWVGADRSYPVFRMDREWEDFDNSTNVINQMFRMASEAYIREQLEGRPDLLEKCLPDYPVLGKRPLLDNGWYRTLRRDNVALVTETIEEITPKGVRTKDGEEHEFDVLILGTGFHAGKFLWPMEITGRGGVTLEERWQGGENPRAYLGITMPDFPNLFCMYGPNTNPVTGSVIFMHECQTNYIMGCLRALLEHDHSSMDCKQEVHDDYNQRLDAEMEQMVWRHPRVHSYYNNSEGRVITNCPFMLYDYWSMTRKPSFEDYKVL